MTIDEAIAHEREAAKIQRNNDKLNKTLGANSPYYKTDCLKCAEEHEQLAEWLEELKAIKSNGRYVQGNKAGQKIGYKDGYNKAIDDLMEKAEHLLCTNLIYSDMEEIAEQLKAGATNGNKNQ